MSRDVELPAAVLGGPSDAQSCLSPSSYPSRFLDWCDIFMTLRINFTAWSWGRIVPGALRGVQYGAVARRRSGRGFAS